MTNNQMVFRVGANWDLLPWLALGPAVRAGTDSYVGVDLNLRFYWWKALQQMRGREPTENLPWIKNAPSSPGPRL